METDLTRLFDSFDLHWGENGINNVMPVPGSLRSLGVFKFLGAKISLVIRHGRCDGPQVLEDGMAPSFLKQKIYLYYDIDSSVQNYCDSIAYALEPRWSCVMNLFAVFHLKVVLSKCLKSIDVYIGYSHIQKMPVCPSFDI